MSNPPPDSSGSIAYDPLPLTTTGDQSGRLYNAPPSAPPSPGPNPESQAPLIDNQDEPITLPRGAAQPRFLGAALYDDPSGPHIRDSYASSHNSMPSAAGSEDAGSTYGFNDQGRMSEYRDDPRDPYVFENNSLSMPLGQRNSRYIEEKRAAYTPPRAKSKKNVIILACIAAAILLILAVIVPVYFAVVKPSNAEGKTSDSTSDTSDSQGKTTKTNSAGVPIVAAAVSGGDGSKVTLDDGTTMTYSNPYGGTWYWDESDPFNNGAKAQSWSPALNETFKYGQDRIRGVNIGGWLNTEPFISPALYQKYSSLATPPVDEWTLSQAMAADTTGGGLGQMETHYKTFITEKDFMEIAAAGLNYVRIPLGYWAIETRGDEPFLAKTSWTYFLKAIKWARKYGIRINLDFHAAPGSQNGWNHSGRLGNINFLVGPMGYANAQRTLDYIRVIAEFISQPEYVNVVTMFGILNEPQGSQIGDTPLRNFYLQAYNIVRKASGVGEGKGAFVSMHDAFIPRTQWAGFLPNSDRVTLDSHPYMCFADQSSADMSTYAKTPCTTWGGLVNSTMDGFGLANAGEYSSAVTDCGLFLNGVGLGTRYEGTYSVDGTPSTWPKVGSCDDWTEWEKWDAAMIKSMRAFTMASIDALGNAFFWTWKIGNSTAGKVESPAWSYQLGLANGWIPKDPRDADGTCGNSSPWTPPLKPWQTGGSGAGNIPAASTDAIPWPPATLTNGLSVATLPAYTPTGVVPTLPASSFTTSSGSSATPTYSMGSGWQNSADNAGFMVEIAGCSYLDPWVGPTASPPPVCAAAASPSRKRFDRRRSAPASTITPAP